MWPWPWLCTYFLVPNHFDDVIRLWFVFDLWFWKGRYNTFGRVLAGKPNFKMGNGGGLAAYDSEVALVGSVGAEVPQPDAAPIRTDFPETWLWVDTFTRWTTGNGFVCGYTCLQAKVFERMRMHAGFCSSFCLACLWMAIMTMIILKFPA